MTRFTLKLPALLLPAALLLADPAWGHGENTDVYFDTAGQQVLTHDRIVSLVRIFGPHFGTAQAGDERFTVNSPWITPGNSIEPDASFDVRFQALRVWNGAGFVDPGGESVSVTHANGVHTIDATAGGSFELDLADPELTWRINGESAAEPDRGVYLIELVIADNDPASRFDDSRPVFFAFDFESGYTPEAPNYLSDDYNHHHHHMSRQYIQNNLLDVPEPGSLGVLAVGSCLLIARRRR